MGEIAIEALNEDEQSEIQSDIQIDFGFQLIGSSMRAENNQTLNGKNNSDVQGFSHYAKELEIANNDE